MVLAVAKSLFDCSVKLYIYALAQYFCPHRISIYLGYSPTLSFNPCICETQVFVAVYWSSRAVKPIRLYLIKTLSPFYVVSYHLYWH